MRAHVWTSGADFRSLAVQSSRCVCTVSLRQFWQITAWLARMGVTTSAQIKLIQSKSLAHTSCLTSIPCSPSPWGKRAESVAGARPVVATLARTLMSVVPNHQRETHLIVLHKWWLMSRVLTVHAALFLLRVFLRPSFVRISLTDSRCPLLAGFSCADT